MSKAKKKILISGSYGTGNTGDEVILRTILDHFQSHDLCVLSQGVEYTRKNFTGVLVVSQVPSLEIARILKDIARLRFLEIKKRVKFLIEVVKCDVFLLGGGGLLAELVPSVLRFYLHQLMIAKFFNKKIIVFCVGVGPLKTDNGKKMLANVLNDGVGFISVRDSESRENLEKAGVKKNIIVSPDPAFLFKVQGVEKKLGRKIVTFNFYPTFNDPHVWKNQLYRYDNLIAALKKMIVYVITKYNVTVALLPFGTMGDRDFALKIYNELTEEHQFSENELSVFIEDRYEEIARSLLEASWNVSMRFHAGLISLANGVPSLCIDQQYKSERVVEQIGISELLISLPDGHHKNGIEDIDIEDAFRKIDFIHENRESISRQLMIFSEKERESLTSYYKNIDEYLEL